MRPNGLTPKESAFVQARLDGKGPSDAYREAYKPRGDVKSASIAVMASQLQRKDHVAEAIASGQEKLEAKRTLTRAMKRQILYSIAKSNTAAHGDRIRAVQVDNRMTGDDAPIRVEGEITLGAILGDISTTLALPQLDEFIEVESFDPNEKAAAPKSKPHDRLPHSSPRLSRARAGRQVASKSAVEAP